MDSQEIEEHTTLDRRIYNLAITLPGTQNLTRMKYDLYLTSKENSFGLGSGYCFDGKVAKGTIEAGFTNTIRITDVVNTRYVRHCSQEPFYEILTKELPFRQSDKIQTFL